MVRWSAWIGQQRASTQSENVPQGTKTDLQGGMSPSCVTDGERTTIKLGHQVGKEDPSCVLGSVCGCHIGARKKEVVTY